MTKILTKLLLSFLAFGVFVSVSYGGFEPKALLVCVVGSFDPQLVQLKCRIPSKKTNFK